MQFTNEIVTERQIILTALLNNRIDEAKNLLERQKIIFEGNKKNMSYLTGGSGLMFLYIKLYEKTNDNTYIDFCKGIALEGSKKFLELETVGNSLYLGKSGLLLAQVFLLKVAPCDDVKALVLGTFDSIVKSLYITGNCLLSFDPLRPQSQIEISYGHGLLGIIYTLKILDDIACECGISIIIEHLQNSIDTRLKDIGIDLNNKPVNTFLGHYISSPQQLKGEHHGLSKAFEIFLGHLLDPKSSCSNCTSFSGYLTDNMAPDEQKIIEYFAKSKINKKKEIKIDAAKSLTSNFSFPHFDTEKTDKCFLAIDQNNVLNLLFSSNYYRTQCYLSAEKIPHCISLDTGGNLLSLTIDEDYNEPQKLFRVKYIFNYELNFQSARCSHIQNYAKIIDHELKEQYLMNRLNVSDKELRAKKLIFKKRDNIVSSIKIADQKSKEETILKDATCFWLFDSELGLTEYFIDPIQFLLFMFRTKKTIKYAIYGTYIYCIFSSRKNIQPIIAGSNSKNKLDLLKRIPFILTYQTRILLRLGILEFAEDE